MAAVIPYNEPDCARSPHPNTGQVGTSSGFSCRARGCPHGQPRQPMPSSRQRCPGQAWDEKSTSSGTLRPWWGGSGGCNCREQKDRTLASYLGITCPLRAAPPLAHALSMETHTLLQPAALDSPKTSDRYNRLSRRGEECVMLGIYNTENQEVKSVLLDLEIKSEACLSLR